MNVITFFSWVLCGLIVGLIARLLVPGRHSMSLLLTMALGIVGAFVGGFLYAVFVGTPGEPFSLARQRLARLDHVDPRGRARALGLWRPLRRKIAAVTPRVG